MILAKAASAEETAAAVVMKQDAQGRIVYREDRPDVSRGWFVAAKSAFWPLCYEALDRLEATRPLIDQGDAGPLAESFEKCGAWLSLAASAAMTEGKAGITVTAAGFVDTAHLIEDGLYQGNEEQLQNAITLAEICMAKSHLLRADNIDSNPDALTNERPNKPATSEVMKEANREVQIDRNEARQAQYRYDGQQIERHLKVAQTYLTQAASAGKFELSETFTAPIESAVAIDGDDNADYIEMTRSRTEAMLTEINAIQSEWAKKANFTDLE